MLLCCLFVEYFVKVCSFSLLCSSFPFNFFLKQFTLPLSDDIPVDEVVNSVLNKSDKLVKQKSKKQRRH